MSIRFERNYNSYGEHIHGDYGRQRRHGERHEHDVTAAYVHGMPGGAGAPLFEGACLQGQRQVVGMAFGAGEYRYDGRSHRVDPLCQGTRFY